MCSKDCDNQFFNNTFCEYSIEYAMSYGFFLIFNLFGYFTFIYNAFYINFGEDPNAIKFILVSVWLFISMFLSRLICIKKSQSNEIIFNGRTPYGALV